jgi:hypothetical protein
MEAPLSSVRCDDEVAQSTRDTREMYAQEVNACLLGR